jgi:hypothetical protein
MKKLFVITLFAIAMGFLESAVVIYLRELYYPNGFDFPLNSMNGAIVTTELWRELATIIMLFSIGYLASHQSQKRFASVNIFLCHLGSLLLRISLFNFRLASFTFYMGCLVFIANDVDRACLFTTFNMP